MIEAPEKIVEKLREMQRLVRQAVVRSRHQDDLGQVHKTTDADTIYKLDSVIEPVVEKFLEAWSHDLPMVVVAEGLEPETGCVFPRGSDEKNAKVRIIIDPVDGTRGLMYDKRSAWSLAGVAPNQGDATRLRDIEISVMTELPTSKQSRGDVLWAIKGQPTRGVRENLADDSFHSDLLIRPSNATDIRQGFAGVSNFFPGTKVLASKMMENIVHVCLGPADVTRAMVFEDQYISTGGQFYELLMGHDRFCADFRPKFYALQNQPPGLCVHPYDCAALLIAENAGVIITDESGAPLDGPLDCTTGLNWAGYANTTLREEIEPVIAAFLEKQGRARR